MSFLMVPSVPITTGTVVVLSPHIRSTSLFRGFEYGVGVEGCSRVNEKAGSILLVL